MMSTVPAPVPLICVPESAMLAVLATVPVLGGVVTVICVPESPVIVPATPPKLTTVAPARPVPVIVTVLPPTVLPLAGDTPVTAGSVTGPEREVPDPVVKRTPRTVPAIATTMAAPMAALTARECRSRERQRR